MNVVNTKVLIGTLYFYVSYWRRDSHFTWSSEPREGLAICRTICFTVRVRLRVDTNPNPNPKTAFFF